MEKRVNRKLHWHIMSRFVLLTVLNHMDRANLVCSNHLAYPPSFYHADFLLMACHTELCAKVTGLQCLMQAYASVQLNADLGLSDYTYGVGSGIFFLGYMVFQVCATGGPPPLEDPQELMQLKAPPGMGP